MHMNFIIVAFNQFILLVNSNTHIQEKKYKRVVITCCIDEKDTLRYISFTFQNIFSSLINGKRHLFFS